MNDFGRVALAGRRVPQPETLGGYTLEYAFLLGMEYQFARDTLGRHIDERARGELLLHHENLPRVEQLAHLMGYATERAPDVEGRVRLIVVHAPPSED